MVRKFLFLVPIAAFVVAGSTACASKGFVRSSVGEVNDKVDSLGRSVEETQEATRQNAARIGEVDGKAEAAGAAAQQANSAAQQANSAATGAQNAASAVNTRVTEIDAAARRLVYEVVLSEDQGNFAFGRTDLPEEAKAALDNMISDLTADPMAAWFEIEGHTDSAGPTELNERLGMERAEAVKRYLYEQHRIPLHKMNVISSGEEKPAGPNDTRAGRAQNRRVVIKVLA
jgi:outer membrane protein OmpA-like peptidoglycan-associated protein